MNRVQAEAAKKATLHLIANHKYYIETEEKKLDQYQLIIDAPESVDLKRKRRKAICINNRRINMKRYNKVCLVESLTQEQLDTLKEKGRKSDYIGDDGRGENVVGFHAGLTFDYWCCEDMHTIITYEEMLTLLESNT